VAAAPLQAVMITHDEIEREMRDCRKSAFRRSWRAACRFRGSQIRTRA
jgi:hypothetical protein